MIAYIPPDHRSINTACLSFERLRESVVETREKLDTLSNQLKLINSLDRKSTHSIIRKEGREASRKGWHGQSGKLYHQILLNIPEHPFQLRLGRANRNDNQ